MSEKRTYNLGRRAETAAETRQRLVEATAALHAERPISATSLRDIAERAGVSVGTAYHHFPTYLDAVRACGAHVAATSPLPDESGFDALDTVEARVQAFVRELCGWYARSPWLEGVRAERAVYPPVDAMLSNVERRLEQLARLAARCSADEARTVAALADVAVYSSLLRAGVPAERIPVRIADVIVVWLRSRSTNTSTSSSITKRRSR